MSSKGAIPLPYIIAIIFGIIIIAVIGYWFFTTSGTIGGSASASQCDAAKIVYCRESQSRNWGVPVFASWDGAKCGPWTDAVGDIASASTRCRGCNFILGSGGECPSA